MKERLAVLEKKLGYHFQDRQLLETALHHASYAHEQPGVASNERLEFLGDAVIGVVVAQLLFAAHPDWAEGDLTRGLSNLVDQQALAQLGRDLEIGPALRLGRAEQASSGETKDSILADGVEAVLAAMFVDGGLEPVIELARRTFSWALAKDAPRVQADPKTRFQESIMARYGEFPDYELVRDSEMEDDEERFTARVLVRGKRWAEGCGRSKRAAERAAAEAALASLDQPSQPDQSDG